MGNEKNQGYASDKLEVTQGRPHVETLWGIVLPALEMVQLTKALEKVSLHMSVSSVLCVRSQMKVLFGLWYCIPYGKG